MKRKLGPYVQHTYFRAPFSLVQLRDSRYNFARLKVERATRAMPQQLNIPELSDGPHRQRKTASCRALLITQNGRRFYFATIPVEELFLCCFVARRDEDPIAGFQRALNESRADDIARYLSQGTGSIPSNIVLSAQSVAQLKYSARAGSISFTPVTGSFLVLDGQHRLWGYHKCTIKHRVPVAIYSGLTRAEEAKLFVDINTTQRGVPAALLLDIKQIAEIESQKEQLLREYFDRLNKDPRSPLVGKLSATKSLTGRISRVTFNRAVASALSGGVLLDADADFRYRLILNYLNAFDAEVTDKRLLVRSAYFEAMMEVLDEVVRSTIALHGNAKQEALQKVIRPLARLNVAGGAGGRALPTKKAIGVCFAGSATPKRAAVGRHALIVPKERIWQELRAEVLSTIPPESRAPISAVNSLTLWYQRGYFAVQSATKRRFELRTAPTDIGSALLADVEHFLDSSAEHQVSLWQHVNTSAWISPAWMTVTFSYWAFFLCLALTRLLGRTVWFMDRQAVRALVALAPQPAQTPGSGCYVLSCGPITSLSERDLTLTKTPGRLHDELWQQWSGICESKLNRLAAGSSMSLEDRLFSAIVRASRLLGPNWQSGFRNQVNYRPAFAYSAVRRDRVLTSLTYLRSPLTYDCTLLLDRLESRLSAIHGISAITNQPQVVAELLVHYTFLLHAVTDALYFELLDRHPLDRRWAASRSRFLRDNGIYTDGQPWPC